MRARVWRFTVEVDQHSEPYAKGYAQYARSAHHLMRACTLARWVLGYSQPMSQARKRERTPQNRSLSVRAPLPLSTFENPGSRDRALVIVHAKQRCAHTGARQGKAPR